MRVLFHSTSSNNVFHVISSLDYLGGHEIQVFHYDGKWNEACQIAAQSNPDVVQYLQAGRYDLVGISREQVAHDDGMIDAAETFKPDIQIYISAWDGLFVPADETLKKLNSISPLVHFCFDQSDPPWWESEASRGNVIRYHKNGCFALQVGIDGGHNWPGGKEWKSLDHGDSITSFGGLTLLTPIDPRPFSGWERPFYERPFSVVYAGNAGGEIRSLLVQRMQRELSGCVMRMRDDHPQSYAQFANFLKMSQLIIDVPFSGSGRAKQVKGRILEAGYGGCAVLTWANNDSVKAWFKPRYEFEEYGSIDEALDMAKWLKSQPKRLEDMARALRANVTRNHSPQAFWSQVFNAVPQKIVQIEAEKVADAA